MSKRVVAIGDLHCGHKGGLTPPEWWSQEPGWRSLEEESWRRYCEMPKRHRPVDLLIVNGDAIDGRGERSGGRELLTTDRRVQCDIARVCIEAWGATDIVMSLGTPYHTGQLEDWERVLACDCGAEIHAHPFVKVDGVTFDIKHKIGSSSIPHGRYTALARSKLWNRLWRERDMQPEARVLLRSHVHYHVYLGGPGWLGMTLPALQMGSDYGRRQCEGVVDWGVVVFDVEKESITNWEADTCVLQEAKSTVLTV